MAAGSVERMAATVESYRDLARRILDRPPRLGGTRLVAVDGPSGGGKTVFAGRLADALAASGTADGAANDPPGHQDRQGQPGRTGSDRGGQPGRTGSDREGQRRDLSAVPVVHTDDLLDGWADQLTFWSRLEDWVLTPLRAGQVGRYRRYSWTRGCFTDRWIPVPPVPVVIIEGVSTARLGVAAELSFAIFVTAPEQLRRERTLARDGPAVLPYLDTWRRGERRHFTADDTARRVDLRVDGASCLPHDARTEYVRSG